MSGVFGGPVGDGASGVEPGTAPPRPAMEVPLAALTPAELRFDAWRRTVGLFAGPLIFVAVWLAPLPLNAEAHRLAAIVSLVVAWWITEALPLAITAVVGAALTVLTGVATSQQAFAPFASPVIFAFIGSFIIGRAIAVHRVDVRIAHLLLSSRLVDGRVSRLPVAMGLLTIGVSGWISGTATAAMMAPLGMGVLAASRGLDQGFNRSYGRQVMLTIAYSASIGSMLTPVGAPSNLVALGALEATMGVRIDFFTWMVIGVPLTIVMAVALFVLTRWMLGVPAGDRRTGRLTDDWKALTDGPWTAGQRNSLIVFGIAAILWITPGVAALVAGSESGAARLLASRLDIATVAILAATLLFVLPTNWSERRFTLDWTEASRIQWGTILLFGGGLSLGQLMFATGLADVLGRGLIDVSGADTVWTVTAVAAAATIMFSQFTSNTATAAMLTPVVLSTAVAAGVNPVPPALAVAFASGVPFLLPISSPPNAIVFGTGIVPITAMMKVGAVLNVVGFCAIVLALRVLCPLLGIV